MARLATYPESWMDIWLWPIIRIFWEPFSKKRSHWWHWRENSQQILTGDVIVKGQAKAGRRDRNWFSNLFQTNFAWDDVLVLKLADNLPYHIGFRAIEGRMFVQQLCSIVIPAGREVSVLIGPYNTGFFAVSADGVILKLRIVEQTTKKDLPSDVILI